MKGWNRSFGIAVACAAALGGGLIVAGVLWVVTLLEGNTTQHSFVSLPASCNVVSVRVHGTIVGSLSEVPVSDMLSLGDATNGPYAPQYAIGGEIASAIRGFARDSHIKALILDIDSTGGDAQAGEEVAKAVRALGKPSIAVIHGYGASSAYLIAAAANQIFSYETSSIGSIGATLSFINQSEKNKKDGLTYIQLSSGKFKDTMSPDKPFTDEERALAMRELNVLHDAFVQRVAAFRHLELSAVQQIADGSVVLGEQAKQLGLVDSTGGDSEAEEYLQKNIGEPLVLCYQ